MGNIVLRARQNVSQHFARFIAYRKLEARKDSGIRSSEFPAGRSVSLKLLPYLFAVILGTTAAYAQSCRYQSVSSTPCPDDCIQEGGKRVCIDPIVKVSQPTSITHVTDGTFPLNGDVDKWKYSNYHTNYPGADLAYGGPWCESLGGTYVTYPSGPNGEYYGYNPTCRHSYSGAHHIYVASYYEESLVASQADAHALKWSNCGSAPRISDSGWGAAPTKSVGGDERFEILSSRNFVHNAQVKTAGVCQGEVFVVKVTATKYRDFECPGGFEMREIAPSTIYDNDRTIRCVAKPQAAYCIPQVSQTLGFGNPVVGATCEKRQVEVDYVGNGSSLLIKRTYRSQGFYSSNSVANKFKTNFGWFWRHNYDMRIAPASKPGAVLAIADRASGERITFDANGDPVENFGNAKEKLTAIFNNEGLLDGWRLSNADDDIEMYGATGRLGFIQKRNGEVLSFSYSTTATPVNVAPFPGLLLTVADTYGRTLQFVYGLGGLISSITTPDGTKYDYGYDSNTNLSFVTYPDGKQKKYLYGEKENLITGYPSPSFPVMLTGIVDENGRRFADFKYDSINQARSTEHAGGVEKYTLEPQTTNYTKVIDPLGAQIDFSYGLTAGLLRAFSIVKSAPINGTTISLPQLFRYDTNGNISEATDANNNKTCFLFDLARNLETTRVEGISLTSPFSACVTALDPATVLTNPARKVTTTWHPTYRLPATTTESTSSGTKTTTNTYDANGNLTQRVVKTQQSTRTWLWSGYDT